MDFGSQNHDGLIDLNLDVLPSLNCDGLAKNDKALLFPCKVFV